MKENDGKGFWRFFGPGLLFAGAAVGTSHFVQSTRAGAVFGIGLLSVVILANFFKYPAFRFGSHYAAATGKSLVDGYKNQGRTALLFLFLVLLFADGFAIAAVSLVTAGIVKTVFGIGLGILTLTAGVMLVAALILILGHYVWLDRLNKIFVGLITFCTLLATAMALPHVDWSFYPATAPKVDAKTMMFVVALAGWMPSALEASVMTSLWTVAKMAEGHAAPGKRHIGQVLTDFDIGYMGTAILAICFVLLGAGVLHAGGIAPADTAPGFAAQIIKLYDSTLGAWAAPVLGGAAISVMFTTVLAVVDGVTRVLVSAGLALQDKPYEPAGLDRTRGYRLVMVGMLIAAMLLLTQFLSSFRAFIDLVTSIAFLTAPLLACFNHRAVFGGDIPKDMQPSKLMKVWSFTGIAVLVLFAGVYLCVVWG
ncbi:NRAMP family divalent metal transporter [Kordiimonas marina]|uniref:NRAMP family divalent metal transporter n=1 Tax=Kordiimonas marina TaxID=2872312 RepID=UPI001FF3416C|nr:divalent metal cation transporter [Kordiimonas marina]MCJ9430502.1 divalent metal cation transporter [Kordiimonas marina]